MVFQVLSGFRKNPDNIEQRGMFELLEIRRLQQFHFQDKILVELVIWGIERSGFFNDREKWVKSFENQRV